MKQFFVSMTFAVDCNQVNPTPGAGQLPEEIVETLRASGIRINLYPTADVNNVRAYRLIALVEQVDEGEARKQAALWFEKTPTFEVLKSESRLWLAEDAGLFTPATPPPAGEPEDGMPPLMLNKYRVTERFGSNVPFETVKAQANALNIGLRIHGNGLVHCEFFARLDLTEKTEDLAKAALDDILADMLGAREDGANLNYRPMTVQIETLI